MKKEQRKRVCPTCGKGSLAHKFVNRMFRVKGGGAALIRGLFVLACDDCGEEIVHIDEVERAQALAKAIVAEKRAAQG